MSINLIPGYDFSTNEVVTKDKIAAWIGGLYNATGDPTAEDLGLVFPDITIVASMTTAASEGMLSLDTTTGMLMINTRWGYTPVAGTKGAMFTRRMKHNLDRVNAVSKVWFNAWEVGLSYDVNVAAAFPASTYSTLAPNRVGYAGDYYGLMVSTSGAAVAHGYMRGGVLWPTAERPMVATTFGTSATAYRPMVAFGGWTPLLSTCVTNSYTAAYMHPTTMAAVMIHGGAYTTITRDAYIKFSVGARNGEALGPTPGYQFGWHYPIWSDAKETYMPRYF